MDWLEMLVKMFGAIAFIDLLAVLLAGTHSFAKLNGETKGRTLRHVLLGVTGGLFGIYATIAGYTMPESNTQISIRDVGAMLGGALGGPLGGLIAGTMAGVFRLFYPWMRAGNASTSMLSGTTIPCAISTFVIAMVTGFLHPWFRKAKHRGLWGLLIGGLSEVFHLALAFVYLTIMHDAGSAWNALKDLIAPFILTNMLGFGLLMYVFDKIRGYRDTETHAKQVEGELGVATSIQGSMLPKIFPEFPGRQEFSISASMVPAKEVGGDFYDFFFTDYDHFVFLVADVSGKGVPAALFMVIAKTLIKNNVQSGLPLADAMSKTNQQLLEGDDQQMFVTAWVGSLQISTGELTYVNCGHNPPLFSKVGQPFDYLKNISGFVLAGSRKSKYKPYTLLMSPGDRIFLYTDGITEAMNANLEQYGEKRLLALANSAPITNTPAIALDAVKADVTKFTAGAAQSDDMTMLALQFVDFFHHKEVDAKTENIAVLSAFLEENLKEKNAPATIADKLDIVIDEIFSNIVKYSGSPRCDFGVFVHANSVIITFEYAGELYDPTQAAKPDTTLPANQRQVGGLGLFIVGKIADHFVYGINNGHNYVTIEKNIVSAPKGGE